MKIDFDDIWLKIEEIALKTLICC